MKNEDFSPEQLGLAIEEIKALAHMAGSNCEDDRLIPVFGAIERLAENAQRMAGQMELEYVKLEKPRTQVQEMIDAVRRKYQPDELVSA